MESTSYQLGVLETRNQKRSVREFESEVDLLTAIDQLIGRGDIGAQVYTPHDSTLLFAVAGDHAYVSVEKNGNVREGISRNPSLIPYTDDLVEFNSLGEFPPEACLSLLDLRAILKYFASTGECLNSENWIWVEN